MIMINRGNLLKSSLSAYINSCQKPHPSKETQKNGQKRSTSIASKIGSARQLSLPYSVRPRPKALVSTPLAWNEVNQNLDPAAFNMKTILPRLKAKGDLFKDVLGPGINLKAALKNVHKYLV